ncbi:MAG: NAD(P)H-dependent oxidoreductase subunit E [Myxococcota bacterium]|jgi:NADH-quinone oxidoreductase subunit E
MQVQIDKAKIEEVIASYGGERGSLLGIFQDVQRIYNYLPREAISHVAEKLSIPLTRAYEVATFYKALSLEPRGRHTVQVCCGTACHVRGAPRLVERLDRDLKLGAVRTTEDGRFTVEVVRCVGACALAPIIKIDQDTHGKVSQDQLPRLLKNYE